MKWNLNKDRALCPQICEKICLAVTAGEFRPGEKIPSVREVAVQAGVNPNTVQRAFETLERDGVLFSVRGSGWFVSEEITKAQEVFRTVIAQKIAVFFGEMQSLGFST